MTDFNKIIAAAMAEGKSIEDIAKEMSAALNEASKPKVTPRDAYLDELNDQVDTAIIDEEFTIEDSIAVLTLCVVENHPNWSLEGIQTFVEALTENIKATEKMIDCVEREGDIFETMAGIIVGALEEKLGNKSKETEGGRQSIRSDDEALRAFLESQGI